MSQRTTILKFVFCVTTVLGSNPLFAQSKITILLDPNRESQGPLSRQIQEMTGNPGAKPVARIRADQSKATWEILHATNRVGSGQESAGLEYGNDEGSLDYGRSFVVMPRSAKRSRLAAERGATTSVAKSSFHERLNQLVESAVDRDVLVFVHGFNVNFDSAVLRSAQIARDMPFSGAIVCYAWPSQGGFHNYPNSADRFETFHSPS